MAVLKSHKDYDEGMAVPPKQSKFIIAFGSAGLALLALSFILVRDRSSAQVPASLGESHASRISATTTSGSVRMSTSIETPEQSNRAAASEAYGKLPLHFEANEGQTDPRIKFLSRGRGYNLFLTSTKALLSLSKQTKAALTEDAVGAVARTTTAERCSQDETSSAVTVGMRVLGANIDSHPAGGEKLPGKINYLIGNDPSKWQTDIPTYARVRYSKVYRGVDLIYHGEQGQLEYDFIVAPNSNPRKIKLEFTGADHLELDQSGGLIMHLGAEEFRQPQPTAYQEIDGVRKEVAVRFVFRKRNRIGFDVGPYDRRTPLTIDPVLSYSSYLGGDGNDGGNGIAVDKAGNAYVTGFTSSSNFATVNPFQGNNRDNSHYDAFVSKVNPSGTELVYSTYIGGTNDERANAIALDSQNNAYITGFTRSTDFPTVNAIQPAYKPSAHGKSCHYNAFVTKLSAAGNAILYSTYLGGSGDGIDGDIGRGIAVDDSGAAYITGATLSGDFPTANALQPVHAANSFFQSADGGANWTRSSNLPQRSITTIAVDAKTPSVLYVSLANGGIWKSIDGGGTWIESDQGIDETAGTNVIAVDPTNSNIVYSGGGDTANGSCAYTPGIYKSSDGGAHWIPINNGLTNKTIRALVIDPKAPTTLYVGTDSNKLFPPDPSPSAALIFKSTDGGASWMPSDSGLVHLGLVKAMAIDPVNTSTLYAAIDECVYQSTDGAATWNTFSCAGSSQLTSIAIDPIHPTTVYATGRAVFRIPGGEINTGLSDITPRSLVIDPASPSNLYVATNSGIFKSTNGGGDWSRLTISSTNLPSVTMLAMNPANSTVYAALLRRPDAFVAKIDPSGSFLSYSTFLGGDDSDDGGGIALDGSGAYVVGTTGSLNFPTQTPIQPKLGGTICGNVIDLGDRHFSGGRPAPCSDAFVTKVKSNGSALAYSTYVGGPYADTGGGIAVDTSGNAYITGFTAFPDFDGPYLYYQYDAFVKKIDSSGSAFVYSKNLGGESYDNGLAIAVDSSGAATVVGDTYSSDFPLLHPFQCPSSDGVAFVTRLNPDGATVSYSTQFGGTEDARSVALDDAGNAYITGTTYSTDLPIVNAFQPSRSSKTCINGSCSDSDAYVSKIALHGVYGAGVSGADLAALKCVSLDPKFTDANYAYTIDVSNKGPQKATGVVVTDKLPAHVSLVSANSSVGSCSGTSIVTCNLGDIAEGDGAVIILTVRPAASGPIINSASVTATSSDPNPTNNSSSVTTYVDTPPSPTPTPTPDTTPKVEFATRANNPVQACTAETATVIRSGDTSSAASVDYSSEPFAGPARMAANYGHITGHLSFAPGETSKSFPVLIMNDGYMGTGEGFRIKLVNLRGVDYGPRRETNFYLAPPKTGPGGDPQNFVCQQYHDLLNRQPDPEGFAFWTDQITSCGNDQACVAERQVDVSTGLLASIEFQQTGYLVMRMYKVVYGDSSGTSTLGGAHQVPVPPLSIDQFLMDGQEISQGVIVGQPGWETVLENNKQAFAAEFIQRFTPRFPISTSPAAFVDQLNANAGNVLSSSERAAAISLFGNATDSSNMTARAQALRQVAENPNLFKAEFNRAFVLMEYFAYLRRNPKDAPDSDFSGYDFWLRKLNSFNGNFVNAEMVKAFITSTEYRQRFGP